MMQFVNFVINEIFCCCSALEYRFFYNKVKGIEESNFFYFVHSFMMAPTRPEDELAYFNYEGLSVTSAIQKDNITGIHLHLEKNGEVGLKVLKQFVAIQ